MTLEQTQAATRKRHGQHYTPALLANFLARRLLATLSLEGPVLRVLDPACGDGELLLAMARSFEQRGHEVSLQLVGYDIDEVAIAVARERAAALGVDATFECRDFLLASDELPSASFDAIITNPPYVRTQQLGAATTQVLAEKYGLTGRIDLTHPFVSIAPRLLNANGALALLCSNRFLSTKAGANVRAVFETHLTPLELYDLGDTKMFGAAVLPAVVIAVQKDLKESTPVGLYMTAYESSASSDGPDLFDVLNARGRGMATWDGRTFEVRAGTLQQGAQGSVPWRMGGTEEEVWFDALSVGTWKTFGEIAKIRVGIKTTADSVFISDRWREMPEAEMPEEDLLLPLTTHHNITMWQFKPGRLSLLYPYHLDQERRTVVDMAHYPRAMSYLEAHRERLEGRKYVLDGGRQWYEIWVPQKPAQWARPKLVFPDISELPKFAFDRSGAVVNGDCYWISVDDIGSEDLAMLMLGVANSTTAIRFYDHVCGNKLYSNRRRWISQYVSRFPVPNPTTPESVDIIRLVKSLVDSGGSVTQEVLDELDRLVEAAFDTQLVASNSLF